MHPRLRAVWTAAILCLAAGSAMAGPDTTCRATGLRQLRAAAPDGYAIYRQVGNPAFFTGWMRCDDAQFDLATAVHESTHLVTSQTDAFPLIGGGAIALPHEVSRFYPPTRIAAQFEPDDFTTIYLRLGKASSSTDVLYLLDELDAYSHDLNAAVDLKDLVVPDQSVDHRDGLAALMAFVAVYVETAREREPETWRGLQEPKTAAAVAGLWRQAERVMAASCGIPNFGTRDKRYIRRYCAAPVQAGLTPILGRAPLCPMACLQPTETNVADDRTGSLPERPHRPTAGPSWIEAIIHVQAKATGAGAGD